MRGLIATALCISSLGLAALAAAHPGHDEGAGHRDPGVVPESEYARARELAAEGPGETRGVESVQDLGAQPLRGEFESAPDDRILRARELTIAPGGVVAVHEHDGRPGVAYIIEGELWEHRSDREAPVLRRQGETAFEYSGLLHWWENRGETRARALVVDIVPEPEAASED